MASCTSPRPFVPAIGGVRVLVTMIQSFVPLSFHLDFYTPLPISLELLSALVLDAKNWIDSEWIGVLGQLLVPPAVVAMELETPATVAVTEFCTNEGVPGSFPYPNNVAVLVRLDTGRSTRGSNGFVWVPNVPDGSASPLGVLIGGRADFYATIFNAFIAGVTAELGLQHVVWSYCADYAWRAEAVMFPVTRLLVSPRLHSRHKRLYGR